MCIDKTFNEEILLMQFNFFYCSGYHQSRHLEGKMKDFVWVVLC